MIKESNLVEVAEYAFANGYKNETVLCWWVLKVLKKRFRILEKVKEICRKPHIYKLGFQVPIDAVKLKS